MMKGANIRVGGRAQWLTALLAMLLSIMCGAAFAISVCGSCGYESDDGARFCSHCGSRFGGKNDVVSSGVLQDDKPKAAGEKVDAAEGGAVEREHGGTNAKSLIPLKDVSSEMKVAKDYLKRGQPEIASLFAKNALALNMLAGEDADGGRYKSILVFIKKCSRVSESGSRRCPSCGGSGKVVMSAHMLENNRVNMKTSGMRCRFCNGSGVIRGELTLDERKTRIGAAFEEYRTLQQSRGMSPEGLAWVPSNIVPKLDIRSRVIIKRAVPGFCSYCLGLGKIDCKTCKGLGVVTCRAKGCHGGYVESDSNVSRLGGGSFAGNKGNHTVKCTECRGTGMQTCKECNGSRSFMCKHCNGSGYADICKKCRGKGLVLCRRCGGSGVYRDKACPYCQKEGSVECSACGGTGRKR
jgi:hypothetical protein